MLLGECSSMGLTGRNAGVGLLATSTLYRYGEILYCFTPEVIIHSVVHHFNQPLSAN